MTFPMDFQQAEQRSVRALRITVILLLVVTAAGLILTWMVAQHYDERRLVAAREVADQQATLAGQPLGDLDLGTLDNAAGSLRQTVGYLGAPMATVLAEIRRAIPVNARLEQLEYDAREGSGSLRVISPDAHSLTGFVSDLERQETIRRAVVARQEVVPGQVETYRHIIHLVAEP